MLPGYGYLVCGSGFGWLSSFHCASMCFVPGYRALLSVPKFGVISVLSLLRSRVPQSCSQGRGLWFLGLILAG